MKKSRSQKAAAVGIPRKLRVNASQGGDLEVLRLPTHGLSCGCCRRPLTRVEQKFCSPRCRLLSWAVKEILEAYLGGKAEGLREVIVKLAEVKR